MAHAARIIAQGSWQIPGPVLVKHKPWATDETINELLIHQLISNHFKKTEIVTNS